MEKITQTIGKHKVHDMLYDVLIVLEEEADSNEDGRSKAIVKTKVQEAIMWADTIYPLTTEL